MKKQVIVCDVRDCKNENAVHFSIFKERKADRAGGMEDWNYTFDLCSIHLVSAFQKLLNFHTGNLEGTIYSFKNELKILVRVE